MTERLLDGRGFPSDLSPLASLFVSRRQRLLSVLIATLVDAVDEDDETLRAATECLGQVVEVLPDALAADLLQLSRAVPEGRADWLGAVLSLAPPAEGVGSVVARLRGEDPDERLATLRGLSRVAPHLGRPPLRWPEPTSRPGELAHLTWLLEPETRYAEADEPTAYAPPPPPEHNMYAAQAPVKRTGRHPVPGRLRNWLWHRGTERGFRVRGEAGGIAVTAPTREAYARLEAPQHVVPEEAFELRVGLAPLPTPEVVQPAPADAFTLDVSVLAHGFAVVGEDPLTVRMRAGLLAHERTGQTRVSAERSHHRNAAHLQTGQDLGVSRHQRGHPLGDLVQQDRIALEPVLVEVLGGSTSGPERELPSQMGGSMDTASKIRTCHRRPVFQPTVTATTPARHPASNHGPSHPTATP